MEEAARKCAPPPNFQGEPELAPAWPPRDFQWRDFQRGNGDFAVADGSGSNGGWKFVALTTHVGVSVSVHSRVVPSKGGLCEFLMRGSLPIGRDVYFALNADMEHRPEWDSTTTSVSELSSSGIGPEAGPFVKRGRTLHWEVKYPWPLGRREYMLEQTVHSEEREGEWEALRCIQGRTLTAEECGSLRPREPGITRIDDYRANMAIWSGPSGQDARFALLYYEDSKVNLPNWLVSKVAASTIPSGLAGTVPVAKVYPTARLLRTLQCFGECPAEALWAPTEGRRATREIDECSFYSASDAEGESDEEAPATFMSPPPRKAKPFRPAASESEPTCSSQRRWGLPAFLRSKAVAFGLVRRLPTKELRLAEAPLAPRRAIGSAPLPGAEAEATTWAKRPALPEVSPEPLAKRLLFAADAVAPVLGGGRLGGHVVARLVAGERDLEEGVALVLTKEERDLLLQVLSEQRHSGSAWWQPVCCPCRRRRNERHKL